ncbi:putative Diguanylate kinase [Blastococcus saxobsidens DD2]|uniref:Putative Diguanylate kinase n=1 Tax=Blastococcus saxobsidens (strain DD2) TaxID=1146883 RepID=H6RTL6_BLASD|nr:putative Diguanylate kinase [Blastococcus saxobsidens DD2]
MVLLDPDRFKEVNDTLGHHVGDTLLRSVAQRLTDELREGTVLARQGGDEFVPVLRDCSGEEAVQVAGRTLDAIRSPCQVEGLTLEVDGSCGVAVHGTSATDLLRHADVAMYAAKADHLGVAVYVPSMDADAAAQLSLSGDLRRAIRDGELVVHYQPRVRLDDGRVVGVEALVRWQHPERGLIPPDQFIPLAEQTGLVRPLTEAVLDQALTDCRRWRDDGLDLVVAVNLSARSLLDPCLADQIAGLLRRHGLPASCLELEITESAAMKDPGRALEVLQELRGWRPARPGRNSAGWGAMSPRATGWPGRSRTPPSRDPWPSSRTGRPARTRADHRAGRRPDRKTAGRGPPARDRSGRPRRCAVHLRRGGGDRRRRPARGLPPRRAPDGRRLGTRGVRARRGRGVRLAGPARGRAAGVRRRPGEHAGDRRGPDGGAAPAGLRHPLPGGVGRDRRRRMRVLLRHAARPSRER